MNECEESLRLLNMRVPCHGPVLDECKICGKKLCRTHLYELRETVVCISHVPETKEHNEE